MRFGSKAKPIFLGVGTAAIVAVGGVATPHVAHAVDPTPSVQATDPTADPSSPPPDPTPTDVTSPDPTPTAAPPPDPTPTAAPPPAATPTPVPSGAKSPARSGAAPDASSLIASPVLGGGVTSLGGAPAIVSPGIALRFDPMAPQVQSPSLPPGMLPSAQLPMIVGQPPSVAAQPRAGVAPLNLRPASSALGLDPPLYRLVLTQVAWLAALLVGLSLLLTRIRLSRRR